MTNTPSISLNRTLQIASASALIALAGIAGCSKSDDAQAAVKQAGRSFSSIAAGDSTVSQSFSEKTYRETIDLVSKHAGSGDGYAEAAAVTLALAKLGQGSLASQDAASAETQGFHKARIIRGMINEWLTMNAIASGASLFDGSQEYTQIDQLIAIRQGDIVRYRQQREAIDAQIAQLDAQIAQLRSKSSVERNESGALELQMPRVSAIEAAKIVERVREHTLRADGYELEAIRIEGVAGQLRPGAREIELNVDKATSQIAMLKEARTELSAREQASKEDFQTASDAADNAAKMIKQAVSEYAQFRAGEVKSANEKAISTVRASISALRDANGPIKQVASLSKASAQQTLAECYSRQAAGYAEEAILYNALDESGVTGNWAASAKAATDLQIQIKALADEAYQGAASALRRAGIRGDEREKLEATAVRLDLLGGVEPEPEFDDSFDEDSYDEETYDEDEIIDEELIDDDTEADPEG